MTTSTLDFTLSTDNKYEESIKNWLEHFVIANNICPFAKKEFIGNRISYITDKSDDVEIIIQCLFSIF